MKRLRIWWCENVVGHLWEKVDASHLPPKCSLEVCVHCESRNITVALEARGDVDIDRMVNRLSHGKISDTKAEWVARAVHQVTPWAGRPIPWDEMPEHYRRAAVALWRSGLEKVKVAREGNQ